MNENGRIGGIYNILIPYSFLNALPDFYDFPFKIVDIGLRLLLREFSVGYEMWIGLAFVFVDPIVVHDANMLKMKGKKIV